MPKHKSRPSRRIRRKNGSIMIMVVALLVLMALLGTAYIATARYDRSSAMQNSDNVQIDILLQSVENFCKTAVAGDLFDGNGNYRAFSTVTNPAPPGPTDTWFYNHTTSTHYDLGTPPQRFDYWLSDRTPDFTTVSQPHYFWPRIGQPLTTESDIGGSVRAYFEDPTYYPQNNGQPLVLRFRHDSNLELGYPPLRPAKIVNGVPMPTFRIDTSANANTLFAPNSNNTSLGASYDALAADADGDGIPDSFLVRMPIGTINGITYYYAVRMVDNAAAVNLNTAFADAAPMSGLNDGWGRRLFPTSINLNRMFSDNEINSIHAYRTQRAYTAGSNITSLNATDLNSPLPDDASKLSDARGDFGFINEHDAFWHQLARRPENPGFIPSSSTLLHYRAFPLADLVSLVPHFVLAPQNSGGVAETRLTDDTGPSNSLAGPLLKPGVTRFKPYVPDDVDPNNPFSWGRQNFDYSNASGYSRRPIVVTSNSVSNAISPILVPAASVMNHNIDPVNPVDVPTSDMLNYVPNYRADWQIGEKYHQGDIVRFGSGYYFCSFSNQADNNNRPNVLNGRKYWEFQPWAVAPQKASLNAAPFRELYRAYWNVMSGKVPGETPYGPSSPPNDNPYLIPHMQKQFRPSLRDVHTPFSNGTYRFPPFQQLLLRAAIAAVNTIDLRDSDNDITSRSIVLNAWGRDGNLHPVEVTVYGSEPQPFITEVYANANNLTDGTGDLNGIKNPKGYVAIELFNPYDNDISLNHWKLGLIDRRRKGRTKDDQIKINEILMPIPFGTGDKIPAKSYIVLENYKDGSDNSSPNFAAAVRPGQVSTIVGNAKRIYVPELRRVFEDETISTEPGGEFVLLRPRRADGQLATGSPVPKGVLPYNIYDETKLYDLVPVDSFDFTGLKLHSTPQPGGPPKEVHVWHYVRTNDTSGDARWKCVYAGRYDGGLGGNGPDPEKPRQEAYDVFNKIPLDPAGPAFNESVSPAPNLGGPDGTSSFSGFTSQFPPIQLNNTDFAGPNPIHQSTPNRNYFPFGGFMRVGDVMQVPYFGAYRVRMLMNGSALPNAAAPIHDTGTDWYQLANPAETLLELNSLPIDSSFADDSIDANNIFENIGRFCPLLPGLTGYPIRNDPNNQTDYVYWKAHTYDFAGRLFDYFTVIAPNASYFPNINPDPITDPLKNNTSAYRYLNGTQYKQILTAASYPDAEPVKSIDNGTSAPTLQLAGVHGLININTANWKVLSTVPWTDNGASNEAIAKAIVQQRDYGYPGLTPPIDPAPFKSIFDLLEVRDPANPTTKYIFAQFQPNAASDPDDDLNDFSPAGLGNKDGVVSQYEFEKAYLLINRVSNLLTTRSDSFTAYIIVQGWRNPNTPQAELVVQRRAAMLIDRAGVTKDNREPRTMLIPVE